MVDAPLAFFSYSRQDSEFVLKLAKDLRNAGAAVWLDQLDIQPGERWDSTVEQALAKCPRMLLVLSPNSVESTNVMDEVSFALEERKLLIPILYRDCKIPFRLRRVQYIDARTDYQRGLHELLRMLGVGTTEATGQVPPPAVPPHLAAAATARVGETPPGLTDEPPVETSRVGEGPGDGASEPQLVRPLPASAVLAPATSVPAPTRAVPASSLSRLTMLIVGAAVVLVVIGGAVGVWKSSGPSQDATSSKSAAVPTGLVTPPPPPIQTNVAPTPTPSRAEPSLAEWVNEFLQASQGPSVRPYYGLKSADWPAIERDKTSYFRRFPTIRVSVVGDPQIRPTNEGKAVDVDVKYANVRNDGQTVQGTTSVSINVRLVDGAWKVVGIQERVAR
jgi:hypothetical protein